MVLSLYIVDVPIIGIHESEKRKEMKKVIKIVVCLPNIFWNDNDIVLSFALKKWLLSRIRVVEKKEQNRILF